MSTTTETARRRSPWVIAIVLGFVLVAMVYALVFYLAVHEQDPIVGSYVTEPR